MQLQELSGFDEAPRHESSWTLCAYCCPGRFPDFFHAILQLEITNEVAVDMIDGNAESLILEHTITPLKNRIAGCFEVNMSKKANQQLFDWHWIEAGKQAFNSTIKMPARSPRHADRNRAISQAFRHITPSSVAIFASFSARNVCCCQK
ncbi:hypothetical protein [Rhizobium leguminosarum]|jgi:hypothetical protein